MVDSYRWYATVYHSHAFVSYKVLAFLIRDGWQPPRRTAVVGGRARRSAGGYYSEEGREYDPR
jgi:hypothetical protein